VRHRVAQLAHQIELQLGSAWTHASDLWWRRELPRGEIGDDETVVLYITGDGLKTIDAVEPTVETVAIEPDVDAVDAALERRVTV